MNIEPKARECWMQKLLLPVAIFVSVIVVGKVCEHFGLSTNVKFGLVCVVAFVVQIEVSRYQRSRQA
ncbi:hypothetical protein F3J44_12160 [Pantoea sp. Tr-811]|uniref:hypothetical protein n=1 Tax=Pantoea sp. Tr-811 TaxID=2608361 RepID=UPI001424A4BD|nr:hypothetical protein [Pantoea sp. Tr-811]NIF27121.1 hypothetical protein [Pantoea sp. Tr-811]